MPESGRDPFAIPGGPRVQQHSAGARIARLRSPIEKATPRYCPSCGAKLRDHNPGPLCSPCGGTG